jgi:hypothetical protein
VSTRILGLVVLMLGFAAAAYMFERDAQTAGPTSQLAQQAESQARAEVAAVNLQAAVPMLEAQRAATGTYAGARLTPDFGVALVRADSRSYCLQGGVSPSVEHLTGPNGAPEPGPCP